MPRSVEDELIFRGCRFPSELWARSMVSAVDGDLRSAVSAGAETRAERSQIFLLRQAQYHNRTPPSRLFSWMRPTSRYSYPV